MDKDHWLPFLKYCHEKKAWAGEDWDPADAEVDDELGVLVEGITRATDTKNDTLDDLHAPSQEAQQSDFVFINREE
jgi:hypothetical protein